MDGRASLPAGRLRGDPEPADGGSASVPPDEAPEDRLRVQYRADVAPAAPGRGLRLRRHHDQGPHHLRRRPRLSHARGGNLRRTDAGPERQSRTVRGAGRDHLQGVRQRALLAQGQALHAAAGGAVSRLHAEGSDARAAADPSSGGDLAAGGERIGARPRLHGEARHQGRGRRRRRNVGTGTDHRVPGSRRIVPARTGSSART